MWVEETFAPDTFYDQTGESFSDAINARLTARKAQIDAENRRIYNAALLTGLAVAGKLKRFEQHFGTDDDKSRGGVALLGALRSMQKKGVPMTIERIKR